MSAPNGLSLTFETPKDGTGVVARLHLSCPPGNRFTLEILNCFASHLTTLEDRADLRAVCLTATGPDFSHGADLSDAALAGKLASGHAGRRELAELGQSLVDRWAALSVPTVVSARGWIIGAGACFFTAADFRYAAAASRMRFPEIEHAMHLSWGIVPRLVGEFGASRARWLALTGEALTVAELGETAVRVVADPDRSALDLAARFSRQAPLAVRAVKSTLAAVSAHDQNTVKDDAERFARTVDSADFTEAVSAFFGKRPARFKGE